MEKEEILKMSRKENAGRPDEYEAAAYGRSSRAGLCAGAVACIILAFSGELIFHMPEIGIVGWLVYCVMLGGSSISLYCDLKRRRDLIYGIIEFGAAFAFAAALIIRCAVRS